MSEFIKETFILLSTWKWLEIINVAASVGMAMIAFSALRTWRDQLKAQKQTDFLDEITKYFHEVVHAMSAPRDMVKYIKMFIESYEDLPQLDKSLKNSEAVLYIQKRGKQDSEELYKSLKPCIQPLSKISSLVAKGQVLGLKNYSECQNACQIIIWQYKRIQALCSIIGKPTLNWENPTVQDCLGKAISLNSDDIEKQIEEQDVKFLNFVKNNYQEICR